MLYRIEAQGHGPDAGRALEYAAKAYARMRSARRTIDAAFARAAFEHDKELETFSRFLPIGRSGKPEEIASVLCSPGASCVVRHALVADGG
jgi:NAD(P)-dependent dehydrogenase (short-subunit alcohol dehydrogenase family)